MSRIEEKHFVDLEIQGQINFFTRIPINSKKYLIDFIYDSHLSSHPVFLSFQGNCLRFQRRFITVACSPLQKLDCELVKWSVANNSSRVGSARNTSTKFRRYWKLFASAKRTKRETASWKFWNLEERSPRSRSPPMLEEFRWKPRRQTVLRAIVCIRVSFRRIFVKFNLPREARDLTLNNFNREFFVVPTLSFLGTCFTQRVKAIRKYRCVSQRQ